MSDAAEVRIGDVIHDGLVLAEVTGELVHPKLGPAWRVTILSGHQIGADSVVFKDTHRSIEIVARRDERGSGA